MSVSVWMACETEQPLALQFMTFISEPYKTTEFKDSHRMILFQPLKPQYFQQKVLM